MFVCTVIQAKENKYYGDTENFQNRALLNPRQKINIITIRYFFQFPFSGLKCYIDVSRGVRGTGSWGFVF